MSERGQSQPIDVEDLTGVWHSRYVYPSAGRAGEFIGDHDIEFRLVAGRLRGESVVDLSGSQLTLELDVEDHIATGTWREKTSPTGYYQGRTFHGVLQFVIATDHLAMEGKWLGFGSDLQINTGTWSLSRITDSVQELTW